MKKIFTGVCCVAFVVLVFLDVDAFVDSGRRGLVLFTHNVLPVLFPFFFISSLLVELDLFSIISRPFRRITKVLFNTPSSSAPVFVLSLLSGYPTGSKMLAELYLRGEISRTEAIRTATFTSTCSPIFIIATLGTILYKNTQLGVLIFLSHIIGAILNGILYKKVTFHDISLLSRIKKSNSDISDAVSHALNNSISNILAVGGLIVIFFVASHQLQVVIPLHSTFDILLSSLLEMTNGVFASSYLANPFIPCIIVSFGGLCVAMQAFVFLKTFRMPLWFYLIYKLTHTILAIGVLAIILLL